MPNETRPSSFLTSPPSLGEGEEREKSESARRRRKIETVDYPLFSVTTRLDCHGRPLEAVINLKNKPVDESMVTIFGALEKSFLPFPGFRILDIPRYYKLGFALGKEEIYVTFRQKHDPRAPAELIGRLRAFLEGGELPAGDVNDE